MRPLKNRTSTAMAPKDQRQRTSVRTMMGFRHTARNPELIGLKGKAWANEQPGSRSFPRTTSPSPLLACNRSPHLLVRQHPLVLPVPFVAVSGRGTWLRSLPLICTAYSVSSSLWPMQDQIQARDSVEDCPFPLRCSRVQQQKVGSKRREQQGKRALGLSQDGGREFARGNLFFRAIEFR